MGEGSQGMFSMERGKRLQMGEKKKYAKWAMR